MRSIPSILVTCIALSFLFYSCNEDTSPVIQVNKGDNIFFIGNNLCSRMMNYGFLETEIQTRYPDSTLTIRNMCDGGNTAGFRPHSGRNNPWAFPGAEAFYDELAQPSGSEGHFESEDEWMSRLNADIIIGFFGFNESYSGPNGIENFKSEMLAFIDHTLAQKYNGKSNPQLVLVSPIAFEDLSDQFDIPNGKSENKNLQLYTNALEDVCLEKGIPFIDLFTPSLKWFGKNNNLTIDGSQLNREGYKLFSDYLSKKLFKNFRKQTTTYFDKVRDQVNDKNWFWHQDFKAPNGVHVFGRRYDPFGPDNYPFEIQKIRELTSLRDTAIWQASRGETFDIMKSDSLTTKLPQVETNYKLDKYGTGEATYLYGDDALNSLTTAEGYKVELFASEKEFKDLANPVQISFDNKGRLWVAVIPTYPHYKPGDSKPNDKLIILEDTDGDGKADKQITWADNLHLPVGFEFSPEGVYVSQGTNLILLSDTDGDDKADKKEIILSGFDDHDTHHVISAFCSDPSGAIYMAEGVFLHTNVETSYGPVRGTNGGFYRYSPQRKHLERTAQLSIPNPWGIAFDQYGQNFFAETSGPDVLWMQPGTVKPRYGIATHKSYNIIEQDHKVRPTSGLEFVSSRHFPENVQGDLLINNTIGFLGMKQHEVIEEGTGYTTKHRHDLITGEDRNFRPVDMEFAPDGSLYFIDWHNVLIGHMQHNARDPLRDHVHGRVYRVTHSSNPLVQPAKVHDASINQLLDNLKLPEYRTRYRTRRELRGRDATKVLSALETWTSQLDRSDANYEMQLLESLWVQWGLNKVDAQLVEKVLNSKDYKIRAAAVRVLRYSTHQIENYDELFELAAQDDHGRVRLEAIVSASWLDKETGIHILRVAAHKPMDKWIVNAYTTALSHLNGESVPKAEPEEDDLALTKLKGEALNSYKLGKEIYSRDGYCGSCHQANGKGLTAAGYPPLSKTKWVQENPERLIKLTLKGLYGPIEVNGKSYEGAVPMTPYEGLLDDNELAAVLTYIRNAFGNEASPIETELVTKVRAEISEKEGFYEPEELLKIHPHLE